MKKLTPVSLLLALGFLLAGVAALFVTLNLSTTPQPTQTTSRAASSCLQDGDSPVVISGHQESRLDARDNPYPTNTKIDARTALWEAQWPVQDSFDYPVLLSGETGICFSGGEIRGNYPEQIGDPHSTWDRTHSTRGIGGLSPDITIERVRINNYGDAIAIKDYEQSWFVVQDAHFTNIRDDCVENDYLRTGVVQDSLLDGCYTGFSARSECSSCDGQQRVWTIRNTLVRLQPYYGVYKNRGQVPGHGGFFKWDSSGISPRLALHNNVFRADQDASSIGLDIPQDKLAECSNNTMVWLGPGNYPGDLPTTFNGQPCFALTRDQSVWDNAKAKWLREHNGSTSPTLTPPSPTAGPATPTPTLTTTTVPTSSPPPSPTPTEAPHCQPLGDIDCSCEINTLDLNLLLAKYQTSDPQADLDDSGRVNALDLSLLLSKFGKTCPSSVQNTAEDL